MDDVLIFTGEANRRLNRIRAALQQKYGEYPSPEFTIRAVIDFVMRDEHRFFDWVDEQDGRWNPT